MTPCVAYERVDRSIYLILAVSSFQDRISGLRDSIHIYDWSDVTVDDGLIVGTYYGKIGIAAKTGLSPNRTGQQSFPTEAHDLHLAPLQTRPLVLK